MRALPSTPISLLFLSLFVALQTVSAAMAAQQPVQDINTQPLAQLVTTNPDPRRPDYQREQKFLRLGGWTFFSAWTKDTGVELFRTNGSKTELVKDINPGVESSSPDGMVLIRGKLYFQAYEPRRGAELWVSDGTPQGTMLFADFVPGPGFGSIYWPTGLSKGRVLCLFSNRDLKALYISDGTAAGTHSVPVNLGHVTVDSVRAVSDGSLAFFEVYGSSSTTGIWVTDGTAKGTRQLLARSFHYAGASFRPLGSKGMLFETRGVSGRTDIWFSLGTTKTTTQLMTMSYSWLTAGHGLRWGIPFKGRIWFAGDTWFGPYAIFSTDGTKGGTQIIRTFGYREFVTSLTTDGKSLWFLREFHKKSSEIWRSDGTTKGTQRWAALPGIKSASLCPTGGKVFLRSSTAATGEELWISDGTAAGTGLVKDILVGPKRGYPRFITEVAPGQVLFSADDGTGPNKWEAWLSKGTAKTTQVLDLKAWSKVTDTADDKVHGIVGLSGRVLFSADNGKIGAELWRSDGTVQGTVLVKDIWPGPKGGLERASPCRLGDKILFAADDGISGRELWISDGTSKGTQLLKDIETGRRGSRPANFLAVKGRVYFTASTQATAEELWVTDGSATGTRLVKEVSPGWLGLVAPELAALPDGRALLSFLNVKSPSGMDTWVSDGSPQGTKRLVLSPILPSGPAHLFAFHGRVFFAGADPTNGLELWVSDGTAKGTSLFLNIASDTKGKTSSSPSRFFAHGGLLYFQAWSQAHGRGLWVSDGTVKGTRYHSKPGAFDEADSFTTVGSRHLYFSAWDSMDRRNLASLDAQGKVKFFSQINPRGHTWPGSFRAKPPMYFHAAPFAVENGALWFSAKKQGYDRQLFMMSPHAVAHDLGDARASTTLRSSDPVQGQSATIQAETTMRNPILLVMLGLPAKRPMAIPPFYFLYYDLASFALPIGIGLGSRIQIGLPIPPDTSLTGAKAMLQAWSLAPRRFPQGLELSNAIHWSLGR